MPCCLNPVAEDPAAVTTVGTGGATLLSITLTVALEDDEILLLLDEEWGMPVVSTLVEEPWRLIPIEDGTFLLFDPAENLEIIVVTVLP